MTLGDRYQSQIFNWVQHYSQQWLDRGTRALRHLKVATQWTVQVMVYPIYWLFQSGRYINHQFQHKVVPWLASPEPQETETDTPILEILAELTQLDPPVQLPSTTRPTPDRLSRQLLQGIASQLDSGKLVLISQTNQTLDILTPQQQQTMQEAIAQKLLPPSPHSLPHIPLSTLAQRPHLFPPIRRFWQLMAWMEQGGVAVAIDSFGESQTGQLQPPPQTNPLTAHAPWLTSLDLHPPTGFNLDLASKQPTQPRTPSDPTLAQPAPSNTDDPWLTSEELFGRTADPTQPNTLTQTQTSNAPEPTPDYIETQATSHQYILSPTEKFLLWLDRILVQVEQQVTKVWRWLNEEV
ncbi:hypothetical protein [Roseofilum capinflatum]|uniref:Uncharacterized protein n=1 Tax=Roseofilum capinflatum BLCC-M114 TaxID=3022440 RepID=A0ABT7B909_9CYAN|nr:hypothetical protein [Roseofilum capinflatum]MDJ1175663.1 hypothetical protein [Roseofilum capinflatum BLCC-M114]